MSVALAIVAPIAVVACTLVLLTGAVVCAYFVAIVEARGWPYTKGKQDNAE